MEMRRTLRSDIVPYSHLQAIDAAIALTSVTLLG
jgi:hypothetical protein